MAKKSEVGIEYFPINTDIIYNTKIKLVVAEFGSKAWGVLLPLYCKIYREKGYWIDWNDNDMKMLFAQDECKIEIGFINEVVNGCIRRSLFEKEVFDVFGILTSDRIQENYFVAKARNKNVNFIKEFALKNEKNEYVYKLYQNVNIIDLNVNILSKNVNILPQSKNESKIIEPEEERECKRIFDTHNFINSDLQNSNLFKKPKIPTFEEVHFCFVQNGGTEEMAKKFFDTNNSVDWFYKGSAIVNFRNLVYGYIESWRKNELKNPKQQKPAFEQRVESVKNASDIAAAIQAEKEKNKYN